MTDSPAQPKNLLAALTLFLLAPLVGEFLLGNMPITWIWLMLVLAPLYGGGALLVRETAVRLGAGWPGIFLLGLAYGIVEEAYVDMSLFNPNFLGLRLLDYGYVPALGIGAWWTVFVLGLHTIWSTAAAIGLAEALWPNHSGRPWLNKWTLPVTALVFLLGCLAIFSNFKADFMPSPGQMAGAAVAIALLVVVTWLIGRRPAAASTAFMLAMLAVPATLVLRWSRRPGWSALHRLALTGGALLTYGWWAIVQTPSTPGTSALVDTIGNGVFAVGAMGLLWLAFRRVRTAE